jgi:hypothetical protein
MNNARVFPGIAPLGLHPVIASMLLCLSSHRLVRASRERAAVSRPLIGRTHIICGGSDTDLRGMVRSRLQHGSLKAATWRCWPAARATGQICLICSAPIVEPDADYTIAGAPPCHAHIGCYRTWVEESVALGIAEPFDMRKPVALRAEPETVGKIMATLDRGQWIYVMWVRRPGYEGKLTKESAVDLRPASGPSQAVR